MTLYLITVLSMSDLYVWTVLALPQHPRGPGSMQMLFGCILDHAGYVHEIQSNSIQTLCGNNCSTAVFVFALELQNAKRIGITNIHCIYSCYVWLKVIFRSSNDMCASTQLRK